MPNLLLGGLLVGLIGLWAFRLWGPAAGLLAAALAAFDPNLVAHGSVATNDLGLVFFGALTIYLLWERTVRGSRSWWLLLAIGAALGLALASKFTGLLLPVVLAVITAAEALAGQPLRLGRRRSPSLARRAGESPSLARRASEAGAALAIVLGAAFLVFWSTYFFSDLEVFRSGLAMQFQHRQLGHPAYLLGQTLAGGWWHYFLVAILVKTPLSALVLIAAGLLFPRGGQPLGWRGLLFLVFPAAVVLAAATASRVDLGLRYVLLVYPLLYVVAARVAAIRVGPAWIVPAAAALLAALGAFSSLRAAPYELAYFNELAGGPAGGLYYLGDSNLDWGQGLRGLRAYMDRQGIAMLYLSYFGTAVPQECGIRCQYLPPSGPVAFPTTDAIAERSDREMLAVSASSLQGTYLPDPRLYRWLLDRKPAATIGHAIYVYDVTSDAEAHWALARAYLELGPASLAVPELEKCSGSNPTTPRPTSGSAASSQQPAGSAKPSATATRPWR